MRSFSISNVTTLPFVSPATSAGTVSDGSLKAKSTEELVVLAQQDNLLALEVLVERYQKLVYVTLHQLAPDRQDIADLAQDALLKMCRSIKGLRNPVTFKFWLNRILTNLYYDELRKSPRRLQTVSIDEWDDTNDETHHHPVSLPDERDVPDKIVLTQELQTHIQQAIKELPEQFRTIIVLREIQGLSYEDIAELMCVNIGTVKSRLARARAKLQEQLRPYLQS